MDHPSIGAVWGLEGWMIDIGGEAVPQFLCFSRSLRLCVLFCGGTFISSQQSEIEVLETPEPLANCYGSMDNVCN
jgi:hypothetical protein